MTRPTLDQIAQAILQPAPAAADAAADAAARPAIRIPAGRRKSRRGRAQPAATATIDGSPAGTQWRVHFDNGRRQILRFTDSRQEPGRYQAAIGRRPAYGYGTTDEAGHHWTIPLVKPDGRPAGQASAPADSRPAALIGAYYAAGLTIPTDSSID